MIRQRLRTRRFAPAELLLRLVVAVAALALIWYGAMTVLLALKVISPHAVNAISGYRTIYDQLTGITVVDVTGRVRIIVAIAGVACFAVFAPLAWRALPRPRLARGSLELTGGDQRGTTKVAPRAIERAAEVAALSHPLVLGAAGRYGTEDLSVSVTVRQHGALPDTLRGTQQRVASALAEHQLPPLPVNVTLTGLDRSNRKELA